MTNFYDRGDVVRLTANFTDLANAPADPTSVTLRVKQPDGTVTVYTHPADITKDSTGTYHYDLSITASGDWYYRYEGTGSVQAAGESLLHVYKSDVV